MATATPKGNSVKNADQNKTMYSLRRKNTFFFLSVGRSKNKCKRGRAERGGRREESKVVGFRQSLGRPHSNPAPTNKESAVRTHFTCHLRTLL